MLGLSMLERKIVSGPTIVYRPIKPSDLLVLERIHAALFPIRYELDFFLNVVNGHGIVSWAAVDINRSDGQNDEIIGFVTTRIVYSRESEISDLLKYESSRIDQTLVYILTLGVVDGYRHLGIASSLVREVIRYASSINSCRAVYLHVIDYNDPAICFYKRMSFTLERRLSRFYYIQGQHYDSFLFVYYVNGGRSPCSPLDLMATVSTYLRGLFTSLITKLWWNGKNIRERSKCRETNSLLHVQNKRPHDTKDTICECV